jgi:hypothetical protein
MEQKISFAVAGFFVGSQYDGQSYAGADDLDVTSKDPAFSEFHSVSWLSTTTKLLLY